jgi:hypothetical protein
MTQERGSPRPPTPQKPRIANREPAAAKQEAVIVHERPRSRVGEKKPTRAVKGTITLTIEIPDAAYNEELYTNRLNSVTPRAGKTHKPGIAQHKSSSLGAGV